MQWTFWSVLVLILSGKTRTQIWSINRMYPAVCLVNTSSWRRKTFGNSLVETLPWGSTRKKNDERKERLLNLSLWNFWHMTAGTSMMVNKVIFEGKFLKNIERWDLYAKQKNRTPPRHVPVYTTVMHKLGVSSDQFWILQSLALPLPPWINCFNWLDCRAVWQRGG